MPAFAFAYAPLFQDASIVTIAKQIGAQRVRAVRDGL
jgi:hypothetical protein